MEFKVSRFTQNNGRCRAGSCRFRSSGRATNLAKRAADGQLQPTTSSARGRFQLQSSAREPFSMASSRDSGRRSAGSDHGAGDRDNVGDWLGRGRWRFSDGDIPMLAIIPRKNDVDFRRKPSTSGQPLVDAKNGNSARAAIGGKHAQERRSANTRPRMTHNLTTYSNSIYDRAIFKLTGLDTLEIGRNPTSGRNGECPVTSPAVSVESLPHDGSISTKALCGVGSRVLKSLAGVFIVISVSSS